MTRLFATSGLAAVIVAVAAAAPAHAQRRAEIHPYIEVGQVLSADLQGGDVLTYSTVSAGIDASVQSRRVEVSLAYRFEKRFSYDDNGADDTIHSGIASVRARVAPGFTMEAGGIATRARSDARGPAPGNLVANPANVSQVYSGYVGPNVSTHVGPAFVNGAYRFGYTKVEAPDIPSSTPGQPALDVYDDSMVHVATASVGVKSGTVLPVGVTASGGYTREDAGQLDQRFEGKFGRGDVVLPVLPTVALTAGVGYENINISQRDALRDGAGNPIVDAVGRQQSDPASPRRPVFDFEGIFWDAGVIWRPSTRTFLEARVGKRYDSWSATGSFSYQIGPGSGVQIGVYDSIESFGRQLNSGLAALPSSFSTTTDPFSGQYSGCVFGTSGNSAGSCLNAALSSAPTANYRARGVTGVLALSRGPNRIGFGAGYSRRTFIAPNDGAGGFTVDGTSDETIFVQGFASTELGRNSSLAGNIFANYYKSGLPDTDGVIGWGANTIYTHRFGGLGATAAVGVYGFEGQGDERDMAAQALVGLRYGF